MKDTFSNMKRREWGKRGGRATLAKHGRDHFAAIGRKGAATFWKRYTMRPAGTSDFAIVDRKTNEVIAFTSGRFGR
jgi:general stress protein YciG